MPAVIAQSNFIDPKACYSQLGSLPTNRKNSQTVLQVESWNGVSLEQVFQSFYMAVAQTGYQMEAIELGYDAVVCHNFKPDKPEYMGREMIKAYDRRSGRPRYR